MPERRRRPETAQTGDRIASRVPPGTDLVEWYFEQGWTDGLPVVPPTREAVDAVVAALGGDPDLVECKVPPRHGSLTREVLAINIVMAGCKPEYAPVVRAAMLALTPAFNLNGVQATTHMAAPLLIVNGPMARRDRDEWRLQCVRLGQPRQCDDRARLPPGPAQCRRRLARAISTRAPSVTPANTPTASPRTRKAARGRPTMSKKGFAPENSTVFVLAAEPPHSVTNHVANDPEGILDSICSAMSTIANNNAVSSGHCAVVIGPEHARTIAGKGWTRHDVRSYLPMHAYNLFRELAFNQRYGKIYNRNLPKWYKREPEARIPIVPSPDHIHLFVIGGEAGRFSAFIPGWGHMSSPVLRSIEGTGSNAAPVCVDGTCYL